MATIQTSLVQFINAEAGDSMARADLRMQVVTAQVVKCLRGNATEFRAGRELAFSLKTKVGKAWQAGFKAIEQAIGATEPGRYAYSGKLTADVAAAIDEAAEPIALAFAAGFEEVMPSVKPEPSEADKAAAEKRKADAEAKRKEKAIALAARAGMVDKESHKAEVEQAARKAADKARAEATTFTASDLLQALLPAITAGELDADEITMLRAALSMVPATQGASEAQAIPA